MEYSNSQNINPVLFECKNEPCKYKVNITGAIQNSVAIDTMRLWVYGGTSKCCEENTFKPRCKSCKQEFVPISSRPELFQRFCRNAEQFIDHTLFSNTNCKKCGQDHIYQPRDWDVGAERRRKA